MLTGGMWECGGAEIALATLGALAAGAEMVRAALVTGGGVTDGTGETGAAVRAFALNRSEHEHEGEGVIWGKVQREACGAEDVMR